jgi:SulP family sulfate permease
MVILDLEGELFFGAAPELARYLDELKERIQAGLRVIILRVKRTRNPDIVCMELLQHFTQEMQHQDVTVLLAGVRTDFAQTMENLRFQDWFPPERIFREDPAVVGSATLSAVRYAYELLGPEVCESCPRRTTHVLDQGDFYYMI